MKQKGFTLIETLLTLAVASVLISVIAAFVILLFDNRIRTEVRADVEFQGIQTMEYLLATIREAEAITAPVAGASAEYATISVFDQSKDPTRVTWSDSALWIRQGTGVPISLTSEDIVVSAPSFEYRTTTSAPGHLFIEFTLSHINPSGRPQYAYTKTFYGSASIRAR